MRVFKYIITIIFAVALVTVGIRASDSLLGGGADDSPCPDEMVFIPSSSGGFCIDKYEASPGDNCPSPEINNNKDARLNIASSECAPVSVKGAKPWVYISQSQAREACARAGKRLPTNKEWYSASLGTPDKDGDWDGDDCQVSENWKEQPGLTGTAELCKSSYEAFDMVGNVWEWTDQTAKDGQLEGIALPKEGFVFEADESGMALETDLAASENYHKDHFWIKREGLRGIARGGFYANEEKAGIYSSYLVSRPSYTGIGVGFRCVK